MLMSTEPNFQFQPTHELALRLLAAMEQEATQDELEALALQRLGETFNALTEAHSADDFEESVGGALHRIGDGIDALDHLLPRIIRGRVTEGQPARVQAGLACAEALLAWDTAVNAAQPTEEIWGRILRGINAYRKAKG